MWHLLLGDGVLSVVLQYLMLHSYRVLNAVLNGYTGGGDVCGAYILLTCHATSR